MALRKKLIIGNWKMNPPTLGEAKKVFLDIQRIASKATKVKTIICPPTLYLLPLQERARTVVLGAQDVFYERVGAFTGETSALMIKEAGIAFSIVGHSERRALGETDDMVSRKAASLAHLGLTPIVCVGERERDHDGSYFAVLRNELLDSLRHVSRKLATHLVIAYEPLWAIGAASAISAPDLHETSIYIKKILYEMYGKDIALSIPIVYGGTVTPENAAELVCDGEVEGLLVGRESGHPKKFEEIIGAINSL